MLMVLVSCLDYLKGLIDIQRNSLCPQCIREEVNSKSTFPPNLVRRQIKPGGFLSMSTIYSLRMLFIYFSYSKTRNLEESLEKRRRKNASPPLSFYDQ